MVLVGDAVSFCQNAWSDAFSAVLRGVYAATLSQREVVSRAPYKRGIGAREVGITESATAHGSQLSSRRSVHSVNNTVVQRCYNQSRWSCAMALFACSAGFNALFCCRPARERQESSRLVITKEGPEVGGRDAVAERKQRECLRPRTGDDRCGQGLLTGYVKKKGQEHYALQYHS